MKPWPPLHALGRHLLLLLKPAPCPRPTKPQAHASASSKPAPSAPKPQPQPAPAEDVAMTDEEREAAAKKAEALREKVGREGTDGGI